MTTYLNEDLPLWRTRAWNFDGLAIGPFYSAVAVTGTCRKMLARWKHQELKSVLVGLTPDWNPNSGTRLGSIESPVAGAVDVGAGAAVAFTAVDVALAGADAAAGALG